MDVLCVIVMLFVPSVRIRPILLLFFWSSRSLSKMQRNDKYQGVVRLLICKNLSPCSFFKVSMMLDKVLVWISVFRVLCPLLLVSLDGQFLIAPPVVSIVYLQCLWIVHSWFLIRFSLTFINKDQLYCLSLPLVQ